MEAPGSVLTATLMFATRSASEFPTAKIVSPMIASESPKMKPNVWGASVRIVCYGNPVDVP